jgi:hypothetical protein
MPGRLEKEALIEESRLAKIACAMPSRRRLQEFLWGHGRIARGSR